MVSEMESVNKNSTSNPVNNTPLVTYNNPQPVHSPQTVGIEFVRQYYTMLNRAPSLLYRDDSTFIHGCLDKPGERIAYVKGQKQINTKIMSLNFENCHTKIRQVDSMETIGNGVVIQVIGELSNNGQPMRRFHQTFVLTPQSPNKYYVRNDIFRYLDGFYYENMVGSSVVAVKNEIETNKVENDSQNFQSSNEKEFAYKTNGTVSIEEIGSVIAPEKVVAAVPISTSTQEATTESIQKVILETKAPEPESRSEHEDEPEQVENNDNLDEIPKVSVSPSANEPKTYAGILGRGSQGPTSNTNSSSKNNFNTTGGETSGNSFLSGENPTVTSGTAPPVGTVPKPPFTSTANTSQQQQFRFQKKTYNRRNDSRESGKNNDSDSGDGGEHYNNPNVKKYPDENQLFIGNLLPEFSEEVLHKIFAKFGKILDVRINRQKMPNSKNRNYGFITFENAEVVDKIIAQKPIYHEKHRYNVEKKQGKGNNYDRNRERNNSNNSQNVRNSNLQSNPIQTGGGGVGSNSSSGGVRHIQTNTGSGGGVGQANLSVSRGNRGGGMASVGPNFTHSPNGNNHNINKGPQGNFSTRQVFTQQQNR